MNTTGTEVLTVAETCRELGISKPTLYRYARTYPRWLRNHLRGNRRLFERAGIQEFLREQKTLTQL